MNGPPIDAYHTYDVKNGSFELLLESPNGQEVYRKEINGITIANGEVKELSETFIFHPLEKGKYTLKYRYWDETKEKPSSFFPREYLWDGTQISMQADKPSYNYGDTANIAVDIIGAGTYHLRFNCPDAGMNEERDIQIPEGIYQISQQFQMPIGLSSSYTANVSVIDSASRETQKQFTLPRNSIAFDYQGNFGSLQASAGSNLEFNIQIKILSGVGQPLNGQLLINSSKLNYQGVKNVILQPFFDNSFIYTIFIPADAPVGDYPFNFSFTINNVEYLSKSYSIHLPAAQLDFSVPSASYNAGETIELNLNNSGGKDGQFNIQALLKDYFNKTVLQKQETKSIPAGSSDSFQLIIPTECKTETYQLVLNSTEILSNVNSEKRFALSINGLTASLNAYTLKENYFDNETISGKAEITTPSTLEKAVLNARIIQTVSSTSGIEEQKHGDFISYNLIKKAYQQGMYDLGFNCQWIS